MSKLPPNPEIIEYATARDRARISPFAVSSAVLGILACGPALLWILALFADRSDWGFLILMTLPIRLAPIALVVALAALLTSLAAIRTKPKIASSSRKLAKGGLVLGIITTLTWGGIFSTGVFATAIGHSQARAPNAAAIQFLNDLSKSPAAASTDCDTNVALSDLSYATGQIQRWGGLGNLTIGHFSMDSNATSNQPSCVLDVTVSAPNGSHYFAIRMKQLSGGWKVYWYRFN
jgi:hypothetical protein